MDGCVAVAVAVAETVAVAVSVAETVAVAEINPSTINPSAIDQSIHDVFEAIWGLTTTHDG